MHVFFACLFSSLCMLFSQQNKQFLFLFSSLCISVCQKKIKKWRLAMRDFLRNFLLTWACKSKIALSCRGLWLGTIDIKDRIFCALVVGNSIW